MDRKWAGLGKIPVLERVQLCPVHKRFLQVRGMDRWRTKFLLEILVILDLLLRSQVFLVQPEGKHLVRYTVR